MVDQWVYHLTNLFNDEIGDVPIEYSELKACQIIRLTMTLDGGGWTMATDFLGLSMLGIWEVPSERKKQ